MAKFWQRGRSAHPDADSSGTKKGRNIRGAPPGVDLDRNNSSSWSRGQVAVSKENDGKDKDLWDDPSGSFDFGGSLEGDDGSGGGG